MRRGNLKLKCFAPLTDVKLGTYSDSSHALVPWGALSYVLVPWEKGKFKNEVSGEPDRSAAWHVF